MFLVTVSIIFRMELMEPRFLATFFRNQVPYNDGNIIPYMCSETVIGGHKNSSPEFCPGSTGKAIKFTGVLTREKKVKGPGHHIPMREHLKSTRIKS